MIASQTGESKNDGGKTDDPWADFRFLQDGQTPRWQVDEHKGWWVLRLSDSEKWAQVTVTPSSYPEEIATDASLEFLDRLRERRVPKFIDSPDALMSFCMKAAVRQR